MAHYGVAHTGKLGSKPIAEKRLKRTKAKRVAREQDPKKGTYGPTGGVIAPGAFKV